jgi:hypothetical protein
MGKERGIGEERGGVIGVWGWGTYITTYISNIIQIFNYIFSNIYQLYFISYYVIIIS